MHKCPKCGREMLETDDRCEHCGTYKQNDEDKGLRRTSSKGTSIRLRKIVPWGIAIFITILLVIIFFLLRNFNSPEAQSKLLINAIDNNDTQKLSTILSTQDNKVDISEAEAYIKYIKKEVGMKQFTKDVNRKIDTLNQSKASESDYVTTKRGEDLLRVSKNGTRYLFFDNMSFTAPTKEAIVKPKIDATYKFKANDKQKTVQAEKGKTTSLGKFIPGDYIIDATRNTENGKFTGMLRFNFDDSNNETVKVNEDFNEAYIETTLSGADDLDSDSIKVKINDRTYDYKKGQTYGPYPKSQEVTVSAEGEAKKKTFKSTETTVKTDNMRDHTRVTLKFDEDEIKKYVEEKEKEESSFKDKITEFFSQYTSALNVAFLENNFNAVSSYLKADTTNYKSTKSEIQSHKGHFVTQPDISEIVKQGDKFYVKAQTTKSDGRYGQVEYVLDGDEEGNHLKIESSSD